jgi:hypothetical protein
MRMVNVGFPAPSRYGFEMVATPDAPFATAACGINRKFTPNQIDRIFCEFSAD